MIKMLKDKKITIFCAVVMLFGILLRVQLYFYNKPFWNDECALALSSIHLSFGGYFRALSYSQAAPPFFLIVSNLFYNIIPLKELALRFFPLVSSCLSIFVFYLLAKKVLLKKSSIIFAIILFCFNYQLIYYGQEFKQYSSDVFIFITILASYFYFGFQVINKRKLVLVGMIYAFCIWLSFTSLFAIFSVLFLFLLKNFKEYKKILLLSLPIGISFVCFYISQHQLASNDFLHNYWQDGFINANFNNLFSIITNYLGFCFNNFILIILFFVGLLMSLVKIRNEKNFVLLIPFVLAIVLSYFSIYPLSSRTSLYLLPVVVLFVVKTIDYMNLKNKFINQLFIFLIILLTSISVSLATLGKIRNFEYENILTPLNIAQKEIKNNDILYVSEGSAISYEFYKNKFNFKNVIIENQRINNQEDYYNYLNKLPKNKKYYYVFSHFPNKKQRLHEVYLWAKNKKNFNAYVDKSFNALIIFTP